MRVSCNYNSPNYKAKFFNTDDLKQVAVYSVENNCFEKLNAARKKINSAYLTRRLKFELLEQDNGYPMVIFTRYTPIKGIIPRSIKDYSVSKPLIFTSQKKMNLLKYGYEMIVKLSNGAPHSNLFKRVVGGIRLNR